MSQMKEIAQTTTWRCVAPSAGSGNASGLGGRQSHGSGRTECCRVLHGAETVGTDQKTKGTKTTTALNPLSDPSPCRAVFSSKLWPRRLRRLPRLRTPSPKWGLVTKNTFRNSTRWKPNTVENGHVRRPRKRNRGRRRRMVGLNGSNVGIAT